MRARRPDHAELVEAIMEVLWPPRFEWGHEETPTEDEVRELADEIAVAVGVLFAEVD